MDPIDELKGKQQFLSGWIADHRERTEQLPQVQQSLDIVNHQIDVVSTLPPALPILVKNDIVTAYSFSNSYWTQFNQSYPTQTPFVTSATGLALEVTGSLGGYQTLSAATIGYSPEVHDWARQKTSDYQAIQQQHDRVGQVHSFISHLIPHRLKEFNRAESSFAAVISAAQPPSVWGIHARNLMEHVKGDFFVATQKARNKQKIKWIEFADTLARGGVGSPEHCGLIAEESNYKCLHSAFTDIAKNLLQVSAPDLRDRRSEFLEYLFSVFSFLDREIFLQNAQREMV